MSHVLLSNVIVLDKFDICAMTAHRKEHVLQVLLSGHFSNPIATKKIDLNAINIFNLRNN